MSETSKAVFLSYASQDAAAVQRIAEALRAAGVEVWFDQNELVGGDAWDAKIRGQIASCVLFVPVISAATQARLEGYFRIEWKLAAQRTHAMADEKAFLLPVVIDDTRDAEAKVPAEFKAVQWTRLRLAGSGGQAPDEANVAAFCARVMKLLGNGAAVVAGVGDPGAASARPATVRTHRRSDRWWIAGGIAVALALGIARPWQRPMPPAVPPSVAAEPTARVWPRDPELRRAVALVEGFEATVEDFTLAEEIAQRAVDKTPADPEAVTVLARIGSEFILRNFDFRNDRSVAARRAAERAVQLAPDEPEALSALATVLHHRAGQSARAEELLRRACLLAPAEPRYWRRLARVVEGLRPDEGLALAEENSRRFPHDPLTRYDLSIVYRVRQRWAEFERETDAALALAPIGNALIWKAHALLMRGDLAGMKTWLERVPPRLRTEERSVIAATTYAVLSGDYDYGLRALRGFPSGWFRDANSFLGPAALLAAQLREQQGRSELARVDAENALAELRRYRAEQPGDTASRLAEAWILRALGRVEEARAALRVALEATRRPLRLNPIGHNWLGPVPLSLVLGERSTALALIREAAETAGGRAALKRHFLLDPLLRPWREDAEIAALLAEPAEKTGAAPGTP